MLPPAQTAVTLEVLRHNLFMARIIHDSAKRRKQFLLMQTEAEQIAWIQQRIDELQTKIGEGTINDAASSGDTTPV